MALASVCAARSIIRMRTIMTFILLCNIHFVATTKPLLLRRYESLEESPFFGMLSLSNWPRFQTIYYCMLFCLSKNTKWRLVYWKGQHIAAAAEFFPEMPITLSSEAACIGLETYSRYRPPSGLSLFSQANAHPPTKIVVQVILWIEDPS